MKPQFISPNTGYYKDRDNNDKSLDFYFSVPTWLSILFCFYFVDQATCTQCQSLLRPIPYFSSRCDSFTFSARLPLGSGIFFVLCIFILCAFGSAICRIFAS